MSDNAERGWRIVPVEWRVPVSTKIDPYMVAAHSVTSYVDGWCPPNVRDVLDERIAALLRRADEQARADVIASVEALPRFHLMRDTDSGCCHASMLGVTDDGPWISREDVLAAIRARAAKEGR